MEGKIFPTQNGSDWGCYRGNFLETFNPKFGDIGSPLEAPSCGVFCQTFSRLVYQGGLDCPCHLDYLGICQEEISQSFPLHGSAAMSFLLMLLQ